MINSSYYYFSKRTTSSKEISQLLCMRSNRGWPVTFGTSLNPTQHRAQPGVCSDPVLHHRSEIPLQKDDFPPATSAWLFARNLSDTMKLQSGRKEGKQGWERKKDS